MFNVGDNVKYVQAYGTLRKVFYGRVVKVDNKGRWLRVSWHKSTTRDVGISFEHTEKYETEVLARQLMIDDTV